MDYLMEAGVMYRHLNEHETPLPIEWVFRYRWRHIPSNKTGERRIAVIEGHIDSLLLHWVNENWIYSRVH